MDKYIYLQKGLKVKLLDKKKCILEEEYVNQIDKLTLDELLEKINNAIENNDSIEEYHEIILNEYHDRFKLFFDIELKKKYNSDYFDSTFENFKDEISSFLASVFIEFYNINSTLELNEDDLKNHIFDGISATTSNDPNKISTHVFFTNILVSNSVFTTLKIHIHNYKKRTTNELILGIDEQVFKNNTLLRCIYSKKSNSKYYHTEYDDQIESVNDLQKYLVTFVDDDEDNILIDTIDTDECELTVEDGIFPHLKVFNGHVFLEKFRQTLFKASITIDSNTKTLIKNLETIELNQTLDIYLQTQHACICGKITHKNHHYLFFNQNNIQLIKYGNRHNCRIIKFEYPKLDSTAITKFIKDLDIVRKVNKDLKLYWDGMKWMPIIDDMIYGKIALKLLDEYKNTMLLHDKKYVSTKYFKEAKVRILTDLSDSTDTYNTNPYLIQMCNGIFDLKNNIFIYGIEAKKYIKPNYIPLSYKNIEEMSEEEYNNYMENYNMLVTVINNIIPENHKDRKIFECNISSSLLQISKETITFLVGPTKSGKTTIKLLLAALFGNLFLTIPIIDYVKQHNPHSPNAWLGKLNGKLVCFASESNACDKFDSQTIKHMTERIIISRVLNSNEGDQHNYATQIIDTNIFPSIDITDNAILERLAVINIDHSYFINSTKIDSVNENILKDRNNILDTRVIRPRNPNFSNKIENGDFSLALFNILKEWVRKYHLDELKIIHTPEKFIKTTNTNKKMDTPNEDNQNNKMLTLVSSINFNNTNKNIKMHNIKCNYNRYYSTIKKLTRSRKAIEIIVINEKFIKEFEHLIPNEYKKVILNQPYVALEHLIEPKEI
ncbi:ORF MSV089 Putative NTPase, Rabbit fibroma virus C5 (vaccinia D5R) homolog, similar to PIR:G41700 [Melanoplus sanguinipes entomopoxvirus]|uniref:ORF MSV089 Putative NTPase, Rabbit fibroma virus C5 (Vaccinia D5R) homolog, similar to PIR:G41700 n=1 Tax=Melanoplus sanguinipes entomopoxvirus TaxID=83191 RepID=Q9YW03_MSEPV|nr:ORF MSV089 Putative NTPase, Rabbit fibroma virus C5 (vaccinia D5R) homolog, similar to PIR:G41700 [Melanoplus sanguinipes entomopoxvirus]AAC97809.1 ORF MSV089 Putative NTPase, Rabbit fibroma virus C5 (vaccinia D5R) homolog, similar to PIR:G41700 [Melanoplus sanguinipes entomopoxvirus 'O']